MIGTRFCSHSWHRLNSNRQQRSQTSIPQRGQGKETSLPSLRPHNSHLRECKWPTPIIANETNAATTPASQTRGLRFASEKNTIVAATRLQPTGTITFGHSAPRSTWKNRNSSAEAPAITAPQTTPVTGPTRKATSCSTVNTKITASNDAATRVLIRCSPLAQLFDQPLSSGSTDLGRKCTGDRQAIPTPPSWR